jgi:hypothetical protein
MNNIPSYKEWLADTLDIDESEINGWDHYDKDSLEIYHNIYSKELDTK